MDDALAADITNPPLSPATPILVGVRAAELQLAPPPQKAQTFALPTVGLSIAFPAEPARFVGRLQPMLRASQALASKSTKRGVLFYGMPGAGKTACAWSWATATSTAASRATSGTAPPRPAATSAAPCST